MSLTTIPLIEGPLGVSVIMMLTAITIWAAVYVRNQLSEWRNKLKPVHKAPTVSLFLDMNAGYL